MALTNLGIKFYTMYIKSLFEYRLAFITDAASNIIAYSMNYAATWVILNRFKDIQGWTFWEIVFLFNINMFSYGLASFFFVTPMRSLEEMVQRGQFDMVLVRPMNPLLNIVMGRPNFAYLGHLVLGTIVFILCFNNLDIQWSSQKLTFLVVAIIGATLIQSAAYLITGSCSFWITKSSHVLNTVLHGIRDFIDYPLGIYGKAIQVILTFLIPFGFVNFYPVQYFLDRKGDFLFYPILQYGTPIVGVITFLIAYKVWTMGIKRYESTGS
jgi:ABC-2 type transport system permease protein